MSVLEATDVGVTFGGLRAVDNVSIKVEEGQLVGLIGPNGAGKTTLIDALTGFVPARGKIRFASVQIDQMPAHKRARLGLARTFQSVELFGDLTVIDNLRVHADPHGLGRAPAGSVERQIERALLLTGLEWAADKFPSEIPHGTKRRVSIARSLASGPTLLLLDEPAAGLEVAETRQLGQTMRGLLTDGISLLLIDHDMELVMNVCDYIYVLNFGVIIASGTPAELRSNDAVISAYLGDGAAEVVSL